MSTYTWLGHASFRLKGDDLAIYLDPYELKGGEPADIICVTHSHHDHFSLDDIAKIATADTVLVAPPDCKGFRGEMVAVKPGDTVEVKGVTIEAVPAYNIGKRFHPKENRWVGYVITLGGTRYYHPGDTDLIPEMKNVRADVAFLPAGGKYTMDAKEAAQAANLIKPKVAIPMHWGRIVGSEEDARAFRNAAQVPVEILKPES